MELEKIKNEFVQELKHTSNLWDKEVINGKDLDKIHFNFLMKKYGDKWIEKSHEFFFKDELFIQRIMGDLG